MTTLIKPAATVILMREADESGFEIFMVKRSSRSSFGSLYVFPGGKLDPEDTERDLYAYCEGMDDEEASARLGIQNDGLSYCCLLYTSPSPRDKRQSRMPSSA